MPGSSVITERVNKLTYLKTDQAQLEQRLSQDSAHNA